MHVPVKTHEQKIVNAFKAHLGAEKALHLLVRTRIRRGQLGHINRIANGLITRRIDDIAQHLLGILYGATLLILVAQEDELMLLTRPKAAHTLPVEFDDSKRQVTLVEHHHFVLVRVLGELVSQREQRVHTVEDGDAPPLVSLVADHTFGVELRYVGVQTLVVVCVVLKVVLVESQAHSHGWQQDVAGDAMRVHAYPFVFARLEFEVAFEQCVVAVLKRGERVSVHVRIRPMMMMMVVICRVIIEAE